MTSLISEIDWESVYGQEGMLVLAAQVTGQPFSEDWLYDEVLVAPIAQHVEDVLPVTPGYESLGYQHPVLASALRHADEKSLLTVARAAVDGLVAPAGLTGVPDDDTEFDELIRMAHYEAGTSSYGGYPIGAERLRLLALDSVRTLRIAPHPLTAAFTTIRTAKLAKQVDRLDPAPMLARFLDLLGNPPAPSGSDGATAAEGSPLERPPGCWRPFCDRTSGYSRRWCSVCRRRPEPLRTVPLGRPQVARRRRSRRDPSTSFPASS